MPPLKKAAKKVAAKSAHHDESKDLRRAYEHLGRVQAMHDSLGKHTGPVAALTRHAEQELKASRPKGAADLLRAAEHLGFGLLASAKAEGELDPRLVQAITEEFNHKFEKAGEHWDHNGSSALKLIFEKTLADARQAFDDSAYRKALELVRAAEALAHVRIESSKELGTSSKTARIAS